MECLNLEFALFKGLGYMENTTFLVNRTFEQAVLIWRGMGLGIKKG